MTSRPVCFGYADTGDYSCRKCEILGECKAEQAATRPVCFGVGYDEAADECKRCIDASVCADQVQKEIVDMDNRTRNKRQRPRAPVRRRPRRPPAASQDAPQPKAAKHGRSRRPQVASPVKDSEYASHSIPDLREELKERGLLEVGRKSILIQRLMNDDACGEPEVVLEKKPAPVPAKAVQQELPTRTIKRFAPSQELKPGQSVAGPFATIEIGQSIVVTRTSKDSWSVAIGNACVNALKVPVAVEETVVEPVRKGLRGKAWKKEVYDPAYWAFNYEDAGNGKGWADMSDEEKYEFADGIDATWEERDNDRINMMRCVGAVYKALDITKYKHEYKIKAVRDALR